VLNLQLENKPMQDAVRRISRKLGTMAVLPQLEPYPYPYP